MAKPRTPHSDPAPPHGESSGGGDPPHRRTAAGEDNMSAAQAQVAIIIQRGRPASRGPRPDIAGPAAHIPLKPPNSRHNLDNVRPKSPAKGKNTIVLPGTDVAADLADISAGRGTWNAASDRYEVNGRTYAVESSGTVFPVSGPGFVNLARPEYKVLKQLIGSDGDINAAREALRRDPSVRDTDWRMALEVFKHHKSYRDGP